MIENRMSVLSSVGHSAKDDDYDIPLWIPTLYNCQYKQRYIMWPVKCSTKTLSKPLKCIFAAVKTGLQKYHHTSFYGIGISQIWILKISKDSLEAISTRWRH